MQILKNILTEAYKSSPKKSSFRSKLSSKAIFPISSSLTHALLQLSLSRSPSEDTETRKHAKGELQGAPRREQEDLAAVRELMLSSAAQPTHGSGEQPQLPPQP